MNQEARNRWDHSNDPEYGQRLLAWIFRSHIWQMSAALLGGAIVFAVVSLFMPPRFGTSATLMVNKSGSGGPSLLSGLSLLGAAPSGLSDEILTIQSRDLGWQVINELGLQVEIYDPQGPDAPLERVKGRLGGGSNREQSREDIYSRLTISDVSVSQDMLKTQEMWISADAQGNWKLGNKSGANGEPVVGKQISFTPHFGGSHKAGYRYLLKVRPYNEAWSNFRDSLTVGPAAEDSSVLSVRANSYNPLLAKETVDLLVDKYLASSRSKTYDEFDQMLSFIAEESQKAQARIDELTTQILAIQTETGIFNPVAQGDIVVTRMGDIATERTRNRIAIRQIDNVLAAMETATPQELNDIIQAPATPLEIESSLVLRLSNLVTSLENHLSNKTEKHPDIINLRKQIDLTVGMIRDSLQSNRESLVLAENELAGDYGELSTELADMPEANSDMNVLNAELKNLRDILEILKKQETETNLNKVQASMDVSLMDPAPFPAKREKPAIGRNAALGGFAGLMLCILFLLFRESTGNRFRTLKELRAGAGLDVIAVLPTGRQSRRWRQPRLDAELAGELATRLFARGKRIGLLHLPAGNPSWDTAACLSRIEGISIVDALPGSGLAGRRVNLLGPDSVAIEAARLKPELSAPAGSRYSLPEAQGRTLYLLGAPSRWSAEAELCAALDGLVLCVPQNGCTGEEFRRALELLAEHGLSCMGVVVSNWNERRDIYGSEELNYVAISSGSGN